MARGLGASGLLLALCSPLLAAPETSPGAPTTKVASAEAQININTATAEQLSAALNGIGPAKAQAIIDYRTRFGPFKAIEELAEIKGIGKATLDKNAHLIVLK
jgi:competence protein ComEA